jgi:DNA-binding transcriptional regulator YiaG
MADKPLCKIPNCDKTSLARGWCNAHYIRWRKYGDPLGSHPRKKAPDTCTIEGCEKPYDASGLCKMHWMRRKTTGSAGEAAMRKTANGTRLKWLKKAASIETDDCVVFPYKLVPTGYGAVVYNGESWLAHRLIMFWRDGPAPKDKPYVLHAPDVCHNRACVNYRHLRYGNAKDNAQDTHIDETQVRGSDVPGSKLTESEVRDIRASDLSFNDLAAMFNVTPGTISDIRRRVTWDWLD